VLAKVLSGLHGKRGQAIATQRPTHDVLQHHSLWDEAAGGGAFLDVTKKGTWHPVLLHQVDTTEVNAGQPGTLALPATPTTTQTSVPRFSAAQLEARPRDRPRRPRNARVPRGRRRTHALASSARVNCRQVTRPAAATLFPVALPVREKEGALLPRGGATINPCPRMTRGSSIRNGQCRIWKLMYGSVQRSSSAHRVQGGYRALITATESS